MMNKLKNGLIQVRILQKQHFYLILLLVENMSHFIIGRKYVPFYLLVEKRPSKMCPSKKRPSAIESPSKFPKVHQVRLKFTVGTD